MKPGWNDEALFIHKCWFPDMHSSLIFSIVFLHSFANEVSVSLAFNSYNKCKISIMVMTWPIVGVQHAGKTTINVFGPSNLSHAFLPGCIVSTLRLSPGEECIFFSLCVFIICLHHNFKQLHRFISAKFSRLRAKWSSTVVQAELCNHAGHQAMSISSRNRKKQSETVTECS